nr:cytidine deaminase [Burkholderia cepacia]
MRPRRCAPAHNRRHDEMERHELIEAAKAARERAYAPYSRFKVGAALLARDGTVFHGCNVENASYGLCNCAERTAMFAAIAAGYRPGDFTRLAVVGDTDDPIAPCGACRQVIIEIGTPDIEVILANLHGAVSVTTADALLPGAFRL